MTEGRGKGAGGREVVIYIAAAIPGLLLRLMASYLRMRRRANKEGRQFYLALVRKGVPRDQAREFADMYSSSISLTQMIREMDLFTS